MMNNQPKVIVFSTPTCSFCNAAKRYFRERNIRFTDVDVSRDQSAARDMMRRTGQMGVPVILINNKAIVGFDKSKIMSALASGGLNIKN
jgi:glutaredoxin 3